tara:strand:+ start:2271 stop:4736 length:2466 start_codon:yes stop_codon:yes gene_type:complete
MKMNSFHSLLESYGKLRKQTYSLSVDNLLSEVNIGNVPFDKTRLSYYENKISYVARNEWERWAKSVTSPKTTKKGDASQVQPGEAEIRSNNPNEIILHSKGSTTKILASEANDFSEFLKWKLSKSDGTMGTDTPEMDPAIAAHTVKMTQVGAKFKKAIDTLGLDRNVNIQQAMNKIDFMHGIGKKSTTDMQRVMNLVLGTNGGVPDTEATGEFLDDLESLCDLAADSEETGCIPNNAKSEALRDRFFVGSPGKARNSLMYGSLSDDSSDGTVDNQPLILQQMEGYEGDMGLDIQGSKAYENYQGVLVGPGKQSGLRHLGVALSNMKMCDSDEPFLKTQTVVSPEGGFFKVRGELNEHSIKLTHLFLRAMQFSPGSGEYNQILGGLAKVLTGIGKVIDVKRETLNKLAEMSVRLDANINGEGFNNPIMDHAIEDVENYGTTFSDAPDLLKVVFSMVEKDINSIQWKAVIDTGNLGNVKPVTEISGFTANQMTGPLDLDAANAIGGGKGDTNKADTFLKIDSVRARQDICNYLNLTERERARIMQTGLLPISDKFSTTSGEDSDLGNQSLDTIADDFTFGLHKDLLLDHGADEGVVDMAHATAKRLQASQREHSASMDKDAPSDRAPDNAGAYEFHNTRGTLKGKAREYSQEKYGANHPIKKMADITLELMDKFNNEYKGVNPGEMDKYEKRKYSAAKRDIVTKMMHMDEMDYLDKLSKPQREKEDRAFSIMTSLAGLDTNPFSVLNAKNYSDMEATQVTSSQIRKIIASVSRGELKVERGSATGFTVNVVKGFKKLLSSKIRNRKGSQTTNSHISTSEASKY